MYDTVLESNNALPEIPSSVKSIPVDGSKINFSEYFNYDPFDNTAITSLNP